MTWQDWIEELLLDPLKIFVFVLIINILMEVVEHKTSISKNKKILMGPLAPLLATATGLVPQCGFSVMASRLYDNNKIKTGTLLAVFLATSDEAFILLLASGEKAGSLMPLIAVKLIVAVAIGYLVNFLFSNENIQILKEDEDYSFNSCGKDHDEETDLKKYFINPLIHSLKILFYIIIVNAFFVCILQAIGEENVSKFLIGGVYFQPFIASLIGLIPNCASSVIITQTYILGGISFGSCVAGLCANAGLGYIVLFKNTKKIKRNILIVVAMYVISVVVGMIINLIELAWF